MANYTNIMLYISGFEDEKSRIKEVNSFISNGNNFSLIDVNDYTKFPDAFPRFLYVGAYKNFDTNEFLTHIATNVNWQYPEYIQLFIQEENDYTLKVYSNGGKDLVLDSKKE